MRSILLVLIHAYRQLISPYAAGACRHVPSCSTYAAEAVRTHGTVMGGWLAIRRVSRCRPFGTYGFDPVPPRAAQPDRVAAAPPRRRG